MILAILNHEKEKSLQRIKKAISEYDEEVDIEFDSKKEYNAAIVVPAVYSLGNDLSKEAYLMVMKSIRNHVPVFQMDKFGNFHQLIDVEVNNIHDPHYTYALMTIEKYTINLVNYLNIGIRNYISDLFK